MNILHTLRSLSLRTKLVILFSMLVGAILLLMYKDVPAHLEQQAEQAQVAKTNTIAQMTAFSLSSALFFSDIQTMNEELRGANLNKDVVYIIIENDSRKALVWYNKDQADRAGYRVVNEKVFLSKDTCLYKASTPILYNNKEIGTLYLGVSLNDVIKEVDASRNNIALISILVFVLGILAVYGISSIMTKPLRQIVKTIEHIAEGDLTHRAEVSSEDEIGHVALSFNRMVNNLQQAQTELEELNRTLEVRVDERTQELKNEIAEKKAAEIKVRESEERYRLLVEMSPDGIAIHQHGKLVFINVSGTKLLGAHEQQELLGKSILDFVHPEYREQVLERVRRMGEGEPGPLLEEKFVKLDGTVVNVEVVAIPSLYQGTHAVQVVIRDITKRKQAEEAFRASEIEMRALFASMRDVILVLDSEGRCVKIAPTDPGELATPFRELLGKRLKEVFPSLQAEFLLSHIQYTLDTRQTHHIEFDINIGGKDVWFLGAVSPMTEHSVILVARDITERKMAEKEYRDLEQKLIQSQKLESIGTLAGGIAHDFNNILAIILGYTGLLQAGEPSRESLKQSLTAIETAVNRGANLVKQILTFARKTDTAFGLLDANVMIKEHAKMLVETFPKTITISIELDKAVPPIYADPTQFHQTLMNLCVNARDSMPVEGRLSLRTQLVDQQFVQKRFSDAPAKKYLCLSIQDTGTGMDQQTKKRIFDPFFTTKGIGKGTGLGLAVVYGIMQSHSGFIDVESEVGKGTIFRLYFPIAEQLETISKKEEKNEQIPGGFETIFFIEDEESLRSMVKIQLEMKGYTVKTASDGEEAVEMYSRFQSEIALVFSDLGLPKLSGEQVFYRLKEMNPGIKFIIATGFIEPDKKMELLQAGVKDILDKPYHMNKILVRFREILDTVTV